MDLSPPVLVFVVFALFATAIVQGLAALGFALVAVNVLAAAIGARDGIVVVSLLTPFLSGLQLWRFRSHMPAARRVRGFVVAAMLGTAVGAPILVFLPGALISIALGLFTAADAVMELRGPRAPLARHVERWLGPAAGFAGGVTNGTLGASGPILGTYLLAIGVRGTEFAFAIALAFFMMGLVRLAMLGGLGQYTPPVVGLAVLILPLAIVGQRAGFWLRGRVRPELVERVLLVLLLVAAVNLLWRGLGDLGRATVVP
jgi:uncharacterized membrane protein YfcA